MDINYKFSSIIILMILLVLNGCEHDSNESCNCNLEPDPGVCEAYIPKYYFDKEENKCKEFIWGGCDGVVPFDTLKECEECGCAQ